MRLTDTEHTHTQPPLSAEKYYFLRTLTSPRLSLHIQTISHIELYAMRLTAECTEFCACCTQSLKFSLQLSFLCSLLILFRLILCRYLSLFFFCFFSVLSLFLYSFIYLVFHLNTFFLNTFYLFYAPFSSRF